MQQFPSLESGRRWLEEANLPQPLPLKVAVGWSGGADSTALLLALAAQGYAVHAWHIDHAWHADSGNQAEELRSLAGQWGIPFSSFRLTPPTGSNRESEARSGRFRAFEALASESGIASVCLAHHRDDQAETVCMRMLQGAGARGIGGMRAVSNQGSLTIYRPLLQVPGEELRASLQAAGIGWLEDASNADTTLWRNRLRLHHFPSLKKAGVDPTELYMRWQRQAQLVAERLEAGVEMLELQNDGVSCSMAWHSWQQLSSELRATMLQRMMRNLFGQASVAGRRHIELVEAWMSKGGSSGVDLSRSRLMRRKGRVVLSREL